MIEHSYLTIYVKKSLLCLIKTYCVTSISILLLKHLYKTLSPTLLSPDSWTQKVEVTGYNGDNG